MTERLLLDEHYSADVADKLSLLGYDVVAVVASPELRASPDAYLFVWAAKERRRIVTENIKDFRPLLIRAHASDDPVARLLLVAPRRFPRGDGRRTNAIVTALSAWLARAGREQRPDEDWLV